MKRLLFPLILLFFLGSCYHENKPPVNKPTRLLPVDTFVMVMADVELTEGALEYRREHHLYDDDDEKRFYGYIYEKYNLTPVSLKENIEYYNSDPKKMVELYDKILAKLTEVQTEQELLKKLREKRIQDSIARLDTTHYVYKTLKLKVKQKDLKELWLTPW